MSTILVVVSFYFFALVGFFVTFFAVLFSQIRNKEQVSDFYRAWQLAQIAGTLVVVLAGYRLGYFEILQELIRLLM